MARRDGPLSEVWRVLAVDDGQALCMQPTSGEQQQVPATELVVVRRFGEPIFPVTDPHLAEAFELRESE